MIIELWSNALSALTNSQGNSVYQISNIKSSNSVDFSVSCLPSKVISILVSPIFLISPILWRSSIISSSLTIWETNFTSYSISIKNFIIPIRHFIQFPQKFIRHNLYPQIRNACWFDAKSFYIPIPHCFPPGYAQHTSRIQNCYDNYHTSFDLSYCDPVDLHYHYMVDRRLLCILQSMR